MPAGICEVVRENHGNKFAGRSRDDSTKMAKLWKKLLNGQATVVSGHATVGWLSNNVFSTFQAIRKNFEKSHWSSRDSGRRSRDRWMTVKQRFLDVSSDSEKFWKKSLKVTRQWSEVTRLLDDCQTTFFRRFKQFEKFLKKVAERSRDSGRRSRDRRLTVKHIYAWIRERERERETISVTLHTCTAMLCRWPFHQQASRLRLALTRVVDRQGQLVYEYCKSSHWQVEFMLCAICRSTFTRQFSRVLTPDPSSLDFSRESPAKDMWCYVAYVYNGEFVFLIGNQRVGISPPKSKILFHPSLALIWCQNFQDWAIPVGGDTWSSC